MYEVTITSTSDPLVFTSAHFDYWEEARNFCLTLLAIIDKGNPLLPSEIGTAKQGLLEEDPGNMVEVAVPGFHFRISR